MPTSILRLPQATDDGAGELSSGPEHSKAVKIVRRDIQESSPEFAVRQTWRTLSHSMAMHPSEANVCKVGCGTPTAVLPNCSSGSLTAAFPLPEPQIYLYIEHFMYTHICM